MLTGVVEVGLFCHMAKAAYFGNQVRLRSGTFCDDTHTQIFLSKDGSVTIKWHDGRLEKVDAGSSPIPKHSA